MSSCPHFCSFSVASGQLFLLIRSVTQLHHLFASVEGCVGVALRVTLCDLYWKFWGEGEEGG